MGIGADKSIPDKPYKRGEGNLGDWGYIPQSEETKPNKPIHYSTPRPR